MLGIWAHPDDESYLTAGVMMRAAGLGHRVVCVTASRGEQGSTDPERWPPGPGLAQLRTEESEQAMTIYGVDEHHWLDYPDGGVAPVDTGEAVDRIMALIGDFVPDLLVTFPPSGLTGHPDHQAVSRWTDEVHRRLRHRPQVLHAVDLQSKLDLFGDRLTELGIYVEGAQPEATADEDALIVELTPDELERKWQGLVVQRSQTELLFAQAGHEVMRKFLDAEAFVAASR